MNVKKIPYPRHVAFIMDGNGRWAQQRGLMRVAGHKQGVETIKRIVRRANELPIEHVTFFAFSNENWARPTAEVNYLMNLPKVFFKSYLKELMDNNVKVNVIGDITGLPESTHGVLRSVLSQTEANTGLQVTFAINYGSQQEIVRAAQLIADKVAQGTLSPADIDEKVLADHLYTGQFGELANPDLVIRTSGEQRLSNFLLWQSAYSELYFTPTFWPDFDAADFDQALAAYRQRDRRFGRVAEDTSSREVESCERE